MHNLDEVKYNDLNNTKKLKTVKDVQQAAHSQGYSVSDPKDGVGDHFDVELTHRKSGSKVTPRHGGKLGGSSQRGDRVDSTLVNQVAQSIKADAADRGRVDKRPKAKAARKAEAAKNKEAKAKNRNPFTRGKTFESFATECNELLNEGEF